MLHALEERARHFHAWEVRGRGWGWNEAPVALEPPFRPFLWWGALERARDDGRHPTALSTFVDRFMGRAAAAGATAPAEVEEPEPERAEVPRSLDEYLILVPPSARIGVRETAGWLEAAAGAGEPIAWELVAAEGEIGVRLATRPEDTGHVLRSLRSFFPEAVARPGVPLEELWNRNARYAIIQEFGLAREFMLPLATFGSFAPDPLLGLYASLAGVGVGELAIVQVLFTSTQAPWEEAVLRAVRTPSGDPVFADAPEVTALAGEKIASRLFAAVLRIAVSAENEEQAWGLLSRVAGRLGYFGRPAANDLALLSEGSFEELEADLVCRTSHRSGMLLSRDELLGLVHLPGEGVVLPELLRARERTKPPPAVCRGDGILLGANEHLGDLEAVRLPESVRLKHCYVVGASGTGKSTLLARMILEDIERGAGVGVLDPHGDLVDAVLERLPEERLGDLVLLDPAADAWAAGWNLLAARSDVEREILASDLVGVFKRLATSWGDQMTAVLANAIQAVLDGNEAPTLLDLRRFLADGRFRGETLARVADPYVSGFWRDEFPLLKGHPQGPILTRLDGFLRSRLIRRVVAAQSGIELRQVLDGGGVLLAKLAQGAIGGENAALLGSLLVSSIHRAALSRIDERPEDRRPFFLYLDEFHEVATPSMASLFTGARKFRLAVTVAHQDLYQLHARVPDVERAVLGNAETRIVFRVGEEDSRTLARGFSAFTEDDLLSLKVGEAIARVGGRDGDFNLETFSLPHVPAEEAGKRRSAVEERMRARFALEAEPPSVAEEAPAPEPVPVREEPRPEVSAAERAAAPAERKHVPPRPPERPGRGGPEHTYLQELIARFAQDRGFRVVVEDELAGGGRVDVALHRGDLRIACEIAVESTVVKELGNVRKCLAAGFDHVAAVSRKEKLKRLLEEALAAELTPAERERVSVFSPEEFLSFLGSLPREEREDVRAGWKVKVRVHAGEQDEAAMRARVIADVLARSTRRNFRESR